MLKTFTPRGLLALIVLFVVAAVFAVGIGGSYAQEGDRHHTLP